MAKNPLQPKPFGVKTNLYPQGTSPSMVGNAVKLRGQAGSPFSSVARVGQRALGYSKVASGAITGRVGSFGARRGLGGPEGRLKALEQGYNQSLAYNAPGARGLINALQGSFGSDPFADDSISAQEVALRQAANLGRRM